MEKTVMTETWQPEGFVLKVERVETPDWGFVAITDDAETHEAMADIQEPQGHIRLRDRIDCQEG